MRKIICACLLVAVSAPAFADQPGVSDVIAAAQAAADAHHAEVTAQLRPKTTRLWIVS